MDCIPVKFRGNVRIEALLDLLLAAVSLPAAATAGPIPARSQLSLRQMCEDMNPYNLIMVLVSLAPGRTWQPDWARCRTFLSWRAKAASRTQAAAFRQWRLLIRRPRCRVEFMPFRNLGHGFLREPTRPDSTMELTHEVLMARVLAFFDKHLKPTGLTAKPGATKP